MYNGIGLATPRGSGTNGHVQRNWALVKPRVKEKTYRNEQELVALDTASNRQPNKEILDHERKRKVELKCAEFADILEEQGFTEEAISNKVNNYRNMLMGQGGKLDKPVDQWGRPCVTETHQVAEAQQEKNARLREAFGISEYFVDGSSFDPDRQAKEKLAKSVALLEKDKQEAIERDKQREHEKAQAARYQLVHTPSPEPPQLVTKESTSKKKKRKHRNSSSSEEPKKKKKKKNRKKDRSAKLKEKKKRKKQKKEDFSEKSSTSENESSSEDEKRKKNRKKEKRKMSKKKKHSSSESSRESSPELDTKFKLDYKQKGDQRYDLSKNKNTVSTNSKEKYSKHEKSPCSRRENVWKGSSNHSKERVKNKRRSKSREIKRKSKSRSLEKKDARTLSPDEKQKDRQSDSCYKDSDINKRHSSKSKSKLQSRSRNCRSRSRSFDERIRHKRNKSVSQERKPRFHRSKSPRKSRSRSKTKKFKLDKYGDKKVERDKLSDCKKSTQSPDISNTRSNSPKSPLYKIRQSPREKTPNYRSQSPKHKRYERSSSPNQLDQKKYTFKTNYHSEKYENIHKNSVLTALNPDKNYDFSSKSLRPQISTSNSINDENISEHETYNKSKSGINKNETSIKVSSRSREDSSDKSDDLQNDERSKSTDKKAKNNKDRNTEKYSSNNFSKQETYEKSLTPDFKSRLTCSPNYKCKSKSSTPDIKKNSKQKDTTEKHSKSKKPLPVVRLRASSNEPDPSDNEFDKEEEEDDKEIKMLKLLKTDLAAKAKESLERKREKPPSPQHFRRHIEPDLFDIKVLPLKTEKGKSQDSINKDEFDIERNENFDKSRSRLKTVYSKIRKSKSRSRSSSHSSVSSKDSQRSKSSSSSSTHSPSRSRTVSRSRSRSSSVSSSTDSSSTTRSRSPSIPRRHGSPSFLDRRRITRHK